MTRPTKTPTEVEGIDAHELPNSAPELSTAAEADRDDQQLAWLRAGPEVFHAPVTQSRSKQIVGLSALAVVVAGLAVAYFVAQGSPDRTGSETTSPPLARPAPSGPTTTAAPVIPPSPVPTNIAPAITPEAPVSPASPVMTPAAPKPTELTPNLPAHRSPSGTNERRDAAVPAPHTTDRPGNDDVGQGAISQYQPPPTSAPAPAPEGWTRVPVKPWKPPRPE